MYLKIAIMKLYIYVFCIKIILKSTLYFTTKFLKFKVKSPLILCRIFPLEDPRRVKSGTALQI